MEENPMPEAATLKKTVSRRRRFLFRGITLVLAVVVACLAGEVVLRLAGYSRTYVNPLQSFHQFDEKFGHRGRPDFTGRFHRREFDVTVEHDARGFRRQQYQNPRSSDRPAVFVFGDSFTWGWGVGQGKVYTDVMSRKLPGCHVENFALSGSGTVQQFEIFRTYAAEELRLVQRPMLVPQESLLQWATRESYRGQCRRRRGRLHLPRGQGQSL